MLTLCCYDCGKIFKGKKEGDKCPICSSNETFETDEERD